MSTILNQKFYIITVLGKCIKGYVSETGLQPCLPCPRNTYQSEEGNTKCLVCPGGGYTDDVGSINKESCSGWYDCLYFVLTYFQQNTNNTFQYQI